MKKKVVCLLILILSLNLTACFSTVTEQGTEIKAYCETMVDAILSGDVDKGLSALTDGVAESEFAPVFAEMQGYLDGVTEYQLAQKGWYSGVKNGDSYYEATFEMTTNAGTFYIVGLTVEGYDRLYHFNISTAEDRGMVYTGTLTTLSGSNGLQWGVLALSVLTLAFTIYCLVDCCKRNIQNKALWMILIVSGMLTITLTSGKINFGLSILSLTYSHLKLYPNGDYALQLVAPLGSILYLVFRRKITNQQTAHPTDDISHP